MKGKGKGKGIDDKKVNGDGVSMETEMAVWGSTGIDKRDGDKYRKCLDTSRDSLDAGGELPIVAEQLVD